MVLTGPTNLKAHIVKRIHELSSVSDPLPLAE